MIYKSYIVEENFDILKNNITLFYGENDGLFQEFKKKISNNYFNDLLIKIDQEQILKDTTYIYSEINSKSLFNDKKIFIIYNANDKILEIIENIILKIHEYKIFIFAGKLDKKSKLRNFFEKNEFTNIVPCYQDNDARIRQIILSKLNDYSGLSSIVVNKITESCGNERAKLNNEIEKIKIFFNKKVINYEKLIQLLNLREDDDFNILRDSAVSGNKLNTNNLLNSVYINNEKTPLYLSLINQRLYKIKETIQMNENIETAINKLRPPIFWKDKTIFIHQCKLWSVKKINLALNITYVTELAIKSQSNINKNTIFKKLIIDICGIANAA